jgi:hypothetical protein
MADSITEATDRITEKISDGSIPQSGDLLEILVVKRTMARRTRDKWISRLDDTSQLELVEERVAFWSNRVITLSDKIAEAR